MISRGEPCLDATRASASPDVLALCCFRNLRALLARAVLSAVELRTSSFAEGNILRYSPVTELHDKIAMMKKQLCLIGLMLMPFLAACSGGGQNSHAVETLSAADSTETQLIGQKLLLDYGTMQARVDYRSEQSLHWEITLADGSLTQGDETMSYERLSPSSYFVSWIEADGTTVSQVLDLKEKTVRAYLTVPADSTAPDARGGRSALLLKGHIQPVENK